MLIVKNSFNLQGVIMPKKKTDDTFIIIAEALSISPSTAEDTYNRAIRKIQDYLLRDKQKRYELQEYLQFLSETRHKRERK